ncbi:DUF2867 domain-containing protein [Hymenobacter lapidiphilus]|uniref:DUF2867 domain-containing protein n=1 Tax=Hymenobacter sp. CCM 8763 TaxID=2303334 RepID=UPI0018F88275|nr:DUF2867 domain-containing protein [Hymenobacter sp. CCM 8763]
MELPDKSVLNKDETHYDYIDSYQSDFFDKNNNISPTEIGKAFFSSGPKWVAKLFALRNKIVRIFGLKTSGSVTNRQKQLDSFKCEPGEQLGLFKVFSKTNNEVVLGEDDKHLNFRVSLLLDKLPNETDKKTLTITTTVVFNNWFGRLYFLPVRPFHKLIVPAMLKGFIKELEK